MIKHIFKLYIAGHAQQSQKAIANIKYICDVYLDNNFELDVIDVLERPQLAEKDGILATPTLIRILPIPKRRFIGDLSDTQNVLMGLDIEYAQDQKDTSL